MHTSPRLKRICALFLTTSGVSSCLPQQHNTTQVKFLLLPATTTQHNTSQNSFPKHNFLVYLAVKHSFLSIPVSFHLHSPNTSGSAHSINTLIKQYAQLLALQHSSFLIYCPQTSLSCISLCQILCPSQHKCRMIHTATSAVQVWPQHACLLACQLQQCMAVVVVCIATLRRLLSIQLHQRFRCLLEQ
ncbi:hypothetical protein E2C01_030871 [Portunus trituberculatus]|uniref:Secreted protein n=1 Tax=Portunus trituberculatus TaxID=210409 RepID=A0A5B7EW28_PORTR|nr:hypothetical protein [Portunus trituberculatus]